MNIPGNYTDLVNDFMLVFTSIRVSCNWIFLESGVMKM